MLGWDSWSERALQALMICALVELNNLLVHQRVYRAMELYHGLNDTVDKLQRLKHLWAGQFPEQLEKAEIVLFQAALCLEIAMEKRAKDYLKAFTEHFPKDYFAYGKWDDANVYLKLCSKSVVTRNIPCPVKIGQLLEVYRSLEKALNCVLD